MQIINGYHKKVSFSHEDVMNALAQYAKKEGFLSNNEEMQFEAFSEITVSPHKDYSVVILPSNRHATF